MSSSLDEYHPFWMSGIQNDFLDFRKVFTSLRLPATLGLLLDAPLEALSLPQSGSGRKADGRRDNR
jgi:hypothetical protein